MISETDESTPPSFGPRPEDGQHAWCLDLLPTVVVVGSIALIVVTLIASALSPLPPLAELWISIVPLHVVAFGAVLVGASRLTGGVGVGDRLGLRLPGGSAAFLKLALAAAIITLCFYPVSLMATTGSAWLLRALGMRVQGSPVLDVLSHEHRLLAVCSVGMVSLVVAPVAEEVLFRLILYESLVRLRVAVAGAVAALLFALLHGVPAHLPGLFLFGLLLQETRRRSGSLLLPIAVHTMFNALSVGITVAQSASH